MRNAKRVNKISDLPARMRDVAVQLATGARNSEVAERLGVSVKTIDTHRNDALRRLGMRNNADLARAAIREGLVSMHDDDREEDHHG